MPQTRNGEKLIDIGCGSGAFTIGAALRGYQALGVSYAPEDLAKAKQRAVMCKAHSAKFEFADVRALEAKGDWEGAFDVAICCEVIEHVKDDVKLIKDIARCLKPGGRLLLTTPYLHYKAMRPEELGPFSEVEDGGHVRRGYTTQMLSEMCEAADLMPVMSFCSGFLSQKITKLFRAVSSLHHAFGWATVLPLRILPPLLDRALTTVLRHPYYCICMEAQKRRIGP